MSMDSTLERARILAFMSEEAYRPLSLKELARALGVAREEKAGLKNLVREMAASGELIKIRGGRFGLPSKMNMVTGELICHPDGFGFVRPDTGGDDIFVSPRRLGGAMHGDSVVARIEPPSARPRRPGRKEGRIIRVVKRAHESVVGRYTRHKGFGLVTPSNERILQDIIIAPRERNGAEDGMIVVAEITRWPTTEHSASGRITELLGDPEDPDVEAGIILKKFGLPNRFPPAVTAAAKAVPAEVTESELRGRVDLRHLTTVTIDGETAKDFDDAVSIERTQRGYRLRVSIADVSHYVKEGSVLDIEAYARGTSVYFPDRCIPMLPEALSNGICSLNPRVDRLTMTAELDFDATGRVTGAKFYESVIKSDERMTYTNVKKLLEAADAELSARYAHIIEDLMVMRELAELLMNARYEHGSIDFDLPEPQIIIDIEGRVEDIVKSERNIAHRIIEEFMLSANKAVASEFSRRGLPFLYRVHDEPDAENMADFAEVAAGFGLYFKPGGGPKSFQRVLKEVDGRPEEKLINHLLLRSMKQAVYSSENLGHFGLAFSDYTHFTSPIRRYPDLVVHRLLKLLVHKRYSGKTAERMEGALPEICSRTSGTERNAMEAEREIADLKKAQFMKDKVGEVYEGFISGVTSFGLFVELKEYFVEGLVHVSTLTDDYYIYEEKRHTLIGENTRKTYRLADPVTVVIAAVDIERRRIDMLLEVKEPEAGVRRGRKKTGAGQQGKAKTSAKDKKKRR